MTNISDIKDPEARAWVHGFMASWEMERGSDGTDVDDEIPSQLEVLINTICPHPTPELPDKEPWEEDQ